MTMVANLPTRPHISATRKLTCEWCFAGQGKSADLAREQHQELGMTGAAAQGPIGAAGGGVEGGASGGAAAAGGAPQPGAATELAGPGGGAVAAGAGGLQVAQTGGATAYFPIPCPQNCGRWNGMRALRCTNPDCVANITQTHRDLYTKKQNKKSKKKGVGGKG
jgi:hypothetical protein